MSRKLFFPVDDESSDVVKRYEQYLSGSAAGYFDVGELESIFEYYLSKGRTKDCSIALDLGFRLHPDNYTLKTKRAKIYLATGDVQKAMRMIDSLGQIRDYEVSLLRVEALVRMDRHKEAREMADELALQETGDVANICLDVAFVFISEGDYVAALFYLESGFNHDKRNSDLLFELAFCYEQTEQYAQAVEAYSQILDIDPFSSEAWFNTGQLYFAMQDYNKSLEAYDFALAIEEKDSLSWLQKANVHFQLNEFNEAIQAYTSYNEITGADNVMAVYIAECYEKLEQYEDAISYYQKAVDDNSTKYEALTGIAICLHELERYQDSIQYIEQALEFNPEAADAWVYMAEAYIGIDDTHSALASYLKSISYDPDQPETLMAIGNICLEHGDYETAVQYYQVARIFNSLLESIDLFLAVAYYKNRQFAESASALEVAIRQDPSALELFNELCPEAENPKN